MAGQGGSGLGDAQRSAGLVGKGNAAKHQVAFMVRALLGLAETPPPDAADALAIAIAHLSATDPLRAKLLERRPI